MNALHFVDTNLLVYGYDDSHPEKKDRANQIMKRLWEARAGRLSHQVLQEFYVTVTRKLNPFLPPSIARREIQDLLEWNPRPVTADILKSAWRIEDRWKLSWWDSLIVASALDCGAANLLTEDMQDGLRIHSLQILNPFSDGFDLTHLDG